jgi:hypothetical protein
VHRGDSVRVLASTLVVSGSEVLRLRGTVVYAGPTGPVPAEIDFDEIILSPEDYDLLALHLAALCQGEVTCH